MYFYIHFEKNVFLYTFFFAKIKQTIFHGFHIFNRKILDHVYRTLLVL